eukprot:4467260-Lingulodinium_polyedra.AAC.1
MPFCQTFAMLGCVTFWWLLPRASSSPRPISATPFRCPPWDTSVSSQARSSARSLRLFFGA